MLLCNYFQPKLFQKFTGYEKKLLLQNFFLIFFFKFFKKNFIPNFLNFSKFEFLIFFLNFLLQKFFSNLMSFANLCIEFIYVLLQKPVTWDTLNHEEL